MALRKNLLSKHCHTTHPTSLSTFSLDFSHHKIQDGTAWCWSTSTCLTKTLKVGELLVHNILWRETEIETGTETERWSDSMTILISLSSFKKYPQEIFQASQWKCMCFIGVMNDWLAGKSWLETGGFDSQPWELDETHSSQFINCLLKHFSLSEKRTETRYM